MKDGPPMDATNGVLPPADPVAAALWRFATATYGAPGVAPACLVLQDRLGADVCLLLFAAAATRISGKVPNRRALEDAVEAVKAWRTRAVLPLRQVRRGLKWPLGEGEGTVPAGISEAFRRETQRLELLAEQYELQTLARFLPPWSGTTLAPADTEVVGEALAQVLLLSGAIPDDKAAVALKAIAAQAALVALPAPA